MRGGSLKRFRPDDQYGGALLMPALAQGLGQTVKRAVKRKVQGVADRTIDQAAGVLAKKAKGGVADLLGH